MLKEDMNGICAKITEMIMPCIKPNQNMRAFNLNEYPLNKGNAIYQSAVKSPYPMTLIYAPAGSAKSDLIYDRISLLKNKIPGEAILVLCMNAVKRSQLQQDLPDVIVKTFAEYIHDIFSVNYPTVKICDTESMTALTVLYRLSLEMQGITDEKLNTLIRYMQSKDNRQKHYLMTLFVNQNMDYTEQLIKTIGFCDTNMQAMLLMNTMQRLDGNPYPDCQALLVLGFNNMPFPTACTLLQYAAKNHPNTFLTGMPSETIYDFAMAYPNMMNGISAFAGDGIDIIHLNEKTKLNDDIKALLELNPSWKFNPEHIQCQCFEGPLDQFSILDVVNKAMEFGPGQIIIAPSKTYLEPLTERIETQRNITRDPSHEHFYIENISTNAPSDIRYGRYIAELCERFYKDLNLVEIEPENLFYQAYNQLAFENDTARKNLGYEAYENDRTCKHRKKLMENISKFYDEFTKDKRQKINPFGLGKTKLEAEPVLSLVYDIICFEINKFNAELEKNIVNPDMNIRDVLHKDGILLSTIHASVDLRATKCIAIIDKQSYKKDFDAIMHVALSRNSEKLCVYIFNASTPDASNPYISILTNISRGETH